MEEQEETITQIIRESVPKYNFFEKVVEFGENEHNPEACVLMKDTKTKKHYILGEVKHYEEKNKIDEIYLLCDLAIGPLLQVLNLKKPIHYCYQENATGTIDMIICTKNKLNNQTKISVTPVTRQQLVKNKVLKENKEKFILDTGTEFDNLKQYLIGLLN